MTRALLGLSLALLLFFAYLTAIRPAFAIAYALGMLFVLTWAWPKLAARGITPDVVPQASNGAGIAAAASIFANSEPVPVGHEK